MARRSGRLSIGREAVRDAVRQGRAHAVLLSLDSGEAIRREMIGLTRKRGIPLLQAGDRATVGSAVGRRTVAVLSIDDPGFAHAIAEAITEAAVPPDARSGAHEA